MPFPSPGSSGYYAPVLTHVAPPPPAVQDKLAALSVDEPLPDTYTVDRISLLVQSPYRLFLYWSHARDPFATLRRAFGATAARYEYAVRLAEVDSDDERSFGASPARNYWFNVRPGRRYRASVGFFAQGRPFIRLLSSAVVQTPRTSVSPVADPSPAFRVSATDFARVLNEAGYASDALSVALEAADAATHDETTRAVAATFTDDGTPPLKDFEIAEMRALIAALAFGESIERVRALVSPPLARWLDAVAAAHGGVIDAARLLDILRSLFAFQLDYVTTADPEAEDRLHRITHFVWGGSDVRLPAKMPHVWMPSMSEGIVSRFARWKHARAGD